MLRQIYSIYYVIRMFLCTFIPMGTKFEWLRREKNKNKTFWAVERWHEEIRNLVHFWSRITKNLVIRKLRFLYLYKAELFSVRLRIVPCTLHFFPWSYEIICQSHFSSKNVNFWQPFWKCLKSFLASKITHINMSENTDNNNVTHDEDVETVCRICCNLLGKETYCKEKFNIKILNIFLIVLKKNIPHIHP